MATSKTTITERQFQALVRRIKKIHEQSASETVDSALETYWTYGDLIAELRLSGEVGYHNSVLRDLSRETGIALRILQHSVAFRGAYSKPPVGQELTWSHYRVLVRVPTAKQRKFYGDLAREKGWTSRELQKAISTDLFEGGKLEDPQLERPTTASFLYKAREVRVIDGDSIEALVDLGFHSLTEQRLRLAQIDAPDLQTKAGRAARNFLIDVLAPAKTIVLNTIKADVHGRYVVHIFCAPTDVSVDECFANGVHVNDLIVREKHAHVVG
jgi:endonuclease YncB( thermonuclease family)